MGLGPKDYKINGIWDLKPHSTLKEIRVAHSGSRAHAGCL